LYLSRQIKPLGINQFQSQNYIPSRKHVGDRVGTIHNVTFGNALNMKELPKESIHLVVTSPPYFNAPFDYPDFFKTYKEFLDLIKGVAKELMRVVAQGRICCFVVDDMLVESILIFQKGKFDYSYIKKLPQDDVQMSNIDVKEFNLSGAAFSVWDNIAGEERQAIPDTWRITNVLPTKGRLEEGIAAFPDEIARRLVKLFTFVGENVLDPFAGSGTTLKVAKKLRRNSFGYEIDLELRPIIAEKLGYNQTTLSGDQVEFLERKDARHLRTNLQRIVKQKESVAAS